MAKQVHFNVHSRALEKFPGIIAVAEDGPIRRMESSYPRFLRWWPASRAISWARRILFGSQFYVVDDIDQDVVDGTVYNTTVNIDRKYNATAGVHSSIVTQSYGAQEWWYALYLVERLDDSRGHIYSLEVKEYFDLQNSDKKAYLLIPTLTGTPENDKITDRYSKELLKKGIPHYLTEENKSRTFSLVLMQHSMVDSILYSSWASGYSRGSVIDSDTLESCLSMVVGNSCKELTHRAYAVTNVVYPHREILRVTLPPLAEGEVRHWTTKVKPLTQDIDMITLYDDTLKFQEYSIHAVSWTRDEQSIIQDIQLDTLKVNSVLTHADAFSIHQTEDPTYVVPLSSLIGVYISDAVYTGTLLSSPDNPSVGEAIIIAPNEYSDELSTTPVASTTHSGAVYPHGDEGNGTPAADSEDTPVNSEDTPVDTEDAPVNSEDAPVDSEDTPVDTEDAPVNSEDAPVDTDDTPVDTEDAPVNSEDAPVDSEDTPVDTEDAPVNSEDAPVD
eukprot:Lankesteria_metandrocarpae@DN2861_c0_g1_i1.p1